MKGLALYLCVGSIIMAAFPHIFKALVLDNNEAFGESVAPNLSLFVETERYYYETDDVITIFGNVGTLRAGQQLLVHILNPNGAVYRFDYIDVPTDGSYTYSLKIGGPNGIPGQYRVQVTDGKSEAGTSFVFTVVEPSWKAYRVTSINAQKVISFQTKYLIKGGAIDRISADSVGTSIIVDIHSTSDGVLKLRYPRNLIQANSGNVEGEYRAYVDGVMTASTNQPTLCEIVSEVGFKSGAKRIEMMSVDMLNAPSRETQLPPRGFLILPSVLVERQEFRIPVVTNADYCDFSISQHEKKLHVSIDGPEQAQLGYLEVTIPHTLLGGTYTVTVNNNKITDFNITHDTLDKSSLSATNDTLKDSTRISLEYDVGVTKSIDIIGTTVIPEFNAATLVMTIAMIGTIGVALITRQKNVDRL